MDVGRGSTGDAAPHDSALLGPYPVHPLRNPDALHLLRGSETLGDRSQNQGTRFLMNSVDSLSTDLDGIPFISKNFIVYDSRSHGFNYIHKLSFHFLVN